MARNIFGNITARGTMAQFKEAHQTVPQIWPQFTQELSSDAPDETHVWLGMLPQPREFVSGRTFQGFRDFTYNVANKEYELSWLVDRTSIEDDKHGLINQRTADAAKVWVMYKDVLMASLLNSGTTSGFNSYDGVTFFNDTHVIGAANASAFDNSLTDDIVLNTTPTVAEMKTLARTSLLTLQGAQDDQGQEGYNWPALGKVLFMGSQNYEQSLKETINATLTGGGDSNPYYGGLGEPIVNPFLGTTNAYLYTAAVGDPARLPLIYQERTKLEIEVLNSSEQVALNHGVVVFARQRFRLTYGEPRRMVLMAITTT